jgi:hypothetical protein
MAQPRVSCLQQVNDRSYIMGITRRANRERPLSTQAGRSAGPSERLKPDPQRPLVCIAMTTAGHAPQETSSETQSFQCPGRPERRCAPNFACCLAGSSPGATRAGCRCGLEIDRRSRSSASQSRGSRRKRLWRCGSPGQPWTHLRAASAHEARCQPLLPAPPSDSHRCQMFRGRKMVAPAPARHARPQVPKLTAQAASCEVPPNWSSVTPNRSVPRKLAPKPMQE